MNDTPGGPSAPASVPAAPAAPTAPPPRRRKRWIALSIVLVLLIIGSIVGFIYYLDARNFESTDDAFIDGTLVPVSSQVDGRIKSVNIRDNQIVAAGDVIAEIDTTDFATRVEQAKAAVAAAQARVVTAQANVDLTRVTTEATIAQAKASLAESQAAALHAQADIEQAQAMVTWAQAQSQSAQADVEAAQAESTRRDADVKRIESLDARAISQQQRDATRSAADSATAQLSAAQKKKSAAEAQVAQEQSKVTGAQAAATESKAKIEQSQGVLQSAQTAPQQIATAEAQVKTAQAAVEESQAQLLAAQQQLSYTKIVVPSAGHITRKAVQPGQFINAGQNLCTIVSTDVWVTANFKETQLTHMRPGQDVDIKIDAYPDRTFKGRVESIQSGTGSRFSLMPPENATGNYVKVVQRVPVKILFTNLSQDALFAPGMSAVPKVRITSEGTPPPPSAAAQ